MLWLLAGVALLVAEALAPGVFLMWLGLAAIGTGATTLAAGLRLGQEVPLFALLAAVSLGVGARVQRRRPAVLNTPQSGLVGRSAVALSFTGREGRVRVGDSDWPARLAPGTALPAASPAALPAALRVVAVEGTVLVVAPAEER